VNTVRGQEKADQPPLPLDKWNLEDLTKSWGLKPKSLSYRGINGEYTFVLEFTKDLKPDELKKLGEGLPTGGLGQSRTLAIYFFDKDNVAVETRSWLGAMGVITGVKGDAFRMRINALVGRRVVKVALRLK
jgi:hypothetical protein